MKAKIFKRILIVLCAIAAAFIAVAGYFAIKGAVLWSGASAEKPIGTLIPQIRSQSGYAKMSELPGFYVDAVISVEDRKFFTHNGINPKSIARALLYDVKTLSFEQGGSTITQQVAKNLWFSEEKKIERKFAEMYAAFALEDVLSKEEIFELYINTIYFGSGYYGITEAARGYFNKSPSELSEYECAMLAGLPNAPSAYSPDASPELARQRLSMVLFGMESNGVISHDKALEVMAGETELV